MHAQTKNKKMKFTLLAVHLDVSKSKSKKCRQMKNVHGFVLLPYYSLKEADG